MKPIKMVLALLLAGLVLSSCALPSLPEFPTEAEGTPTPAPTEKMEDEPMVIRSPLEEKLDTMSLRQKSGNCL